MDVRAGPYRRLSIKELMLLNCGVGEDSWESLGLQGDHTSKSSGKSTLNIHWKDWWWSWNSNTLTTWFEELTRLKRPWCWERLKVGGEENDRGWDSWMASPTQWTWVWASSRRWWRTGKPGMLQSMGSQRVRHDWATEQQWTNHFTTLAHSIISTVLWGEWVSESRSVVSECDPMDHTPWNSSGQNTGVGSLSLLQGIFSTQGSNPGLPHCRQIFFLPAEPQGKPSYEVGTISSPILKMRKIRHKEVKAMQTVSGSAGIHMQAVWLLRPWLIFLFLG